MISVINKQYFTDPAAAITYLIEQEVIPLRMACQGCNAEMVLNQMRGMYRCSNRGCNKEKSMLTNTFFARARLPLQKLLFLTGLWLNKVGRDAAAGMAEVSKNSVTKHFHNLKNLVADDVEMEEAVIGGQGITVEIDESKFGKRKYNRGHRVEGCWVFGGVERTAERRCFAVPVQQRDAATLIPLITTHIRPGSIIISDMWRAYNFIPADYEHLTVNHSLHFVDPLTGTHTNTIEATWNAMKKDIPVRNRRPEGMEEELWTFMWRRVHKDDLWGGIINAFKNVDYLVAEVEE
jgi:transposase-like protein